MAPTLRDLVKRQYYDNYCDSGYYYYNNYGCYSAWNSWGRWVLLAGIVVGAFFLYLLFACITARRRRRAGRNPYPMTAWASRPQANTQWANQNSYGQQGGYNQPPPAYGGQQYGGQQYGVAQPQPVYGANRDINNGHYAPPAGPPPGKGNDQLVR